MTKPAPAKTDRHSGTGHPIKGEVKRDGTGKGNWGTPKDELLADSGVNDPKDPNYEAKVPQPMGMPHSFEEIQKEQASTSN